MPVKAQIKLLVVVDESVKYLEQVEEALELQRQDYLTGTDGEVDVVWDIKRQDLSNLPWQIYWADNWGVDTTWVTDNTKDLGDYDSVAFVIDWDNWTKEGNQSIWGWNLGRFYNGYQVQLIRFADNNIKSVYYTFLMELFHALDDFYYKDTGKRLEELFNVTDFDEDIVHARHDDYEVFKYIPAVRQMKDILIELFKIKESVGESFMKLVIKDGEQYLRNEKGEDRHIVNVFSLKDFVASGIIESTVPEVVDIVNPTGMEWGVLPQS